MNFTEYDLDFFHCPECNDTGLINRIDENGILYSSECSCMTRRLALRQLKQSGLDSLIKRYTFEAYRTPDAFTEALKNIALQYCESRPAWLYLSGKPGSGKTHLCTAICSHFLKAGETVLYIVWPEESGKMKSMKAGDPPDPEYKKELERLKKASVLYLDDFLRGKTTAADIRLAFEILNARYNNPKLRTILSSEIPVEQIGDAAIAGRIRERAKGYVLKAPERDWRNRR